MRRVRAIIVKQDCILLIKRIKKDSTYWVFPGGGVEPKETTRNALIREVKEELGVDVRVMRYFSKMKSSKLETKGQWESFYSCEIIGGILGNVDGPEYKKGSNYKGKYEITWLPISEMRQVALRPEEMRDLVFKKIG